MMCHRSSVAVLISTRPCSRTRTPWRIAFSTSGCTVSGGTEKHTWYTDDGRRTVHSDALDTEKDILFYENDPAVPENTVYLNPGDYVIYFPWDVHAPGQHPDGQPSSFRKIVLKVPTAACV